MKVNITTAIILMGFMVACSSSQSVGVNKITTAEWQHLIDSMRKQKDNEFAANKNSPFASLEDDFTGLKYYKPDINYNVSVHWNQPDTTFLREIADSKGGKRQYRFYGDFNFDIEGKSCKLPVWIDERFPKLLFLMFRDKTNGKETYGGGRYIEMNKPEKAENLFIDFNQAFNPYCHYNKNYSCPVVPLDQLLDVEIKAGEKLYFEH